MTRANKQPSSDTERPAMLSIYSGGSCVGFVMPRGPAGAEAFGADEDSLGLFPDQRSAAAAISQPYGRRA